MLQSKDRVADVIKKLEPTTGCLQETRFGAKDTQRLKVSGERPREPVLCPSDPRCSRGPRSLAWMFHLASDQGSQEPWLATYFAAPNMGPVPFWGKDLGPSGTMECSCPWVTSGHLNPLFQHHRIWRLPSWPWGPQCLTQAMPPPPLCPFPLLKSSLSLCPTLPRVDVGQLQHPSSQPVKSAPSGGWRAEVERLASHRTDPSPEGSPPET